MAYHLFVPFQGHMQTSYSLLGPYLDLEGSSIYLKMITALIIILLQAYLINDLVIKHKLSRALSTIPAAVFILYSCWVLGAQLYHPILIANTFFILSLNSLFKIYKRHQPIATIFNSGFWLALACCFHTPYLIYVLILLLGLLSLRSIELREALQMLTGVLIPFFLLGIALFYLSKLSLVSGAFSQSIGLPNLSDLTIASVAKPVLVLVFILISVFFNGEIKKKKKFDAIKKVELAYWIFFIALFTIIFGKTLNEAHLIMVSVPIALCYGLYLESKNNKILKEFFFVLAIGIHVIFLIGILN